MAKQMKHAEIGGIPDLLRLVEEVRASEDPTLLRRDGEDLALLMPIRSRRRRPVKWRPVTEDDALWEIVGIGRSVGPTDVSENKHKYLADASALEDVYTLGNSDFRSSEDGSGTAFTIAFKQTKSATWAPAHPSYT